MEEEFKTFRDQEEADKKLDDIFDELCEIDGIGDFSTIIRTDHLLDILGCSLYFINEYYKDKLPGIDFKMLLKLDYRLDDVNDCILITDASDMNKIYFKFANYDSSDGITIDLDDDYIIRIFDIVSERLAGCTIDSKFLKQVFYNLIRAEYEVLKDTINVYGDHELFIGFEI